MGAVADARFRRLLVGRSVSSFGDSALYLSLGIWAKQLTGSNAAAGEVFLAMGLACLCAPLAGQLADRLDRRWLLIVTNAVTGLVVLSLLGVRGRDQLWILYSVALVYGINGALSSAATAGVVRDLLSDADLPGANAAIQTVGQGLRLISPAVGAGLFVWLGGAGLAILDAATFALLIVALASIHLPRTPSVPRDEPGGRRGVLAGVRHLRRVRLLGQVTLGCAIAMLVLGFYESVTFAVIAAIHRPPSFFGVLMSVQAAGSIAGGLLTTRLMTRLGEARSLGVALAAWVGATAIYTIPTLPTALLALLLFGAAIPVSAVAVATANQRYTPRHLQGRVTAASDLLINLSQTASIAIGAALVDTVGYEPLLVIAASVLLLPATALITRPAAGPRLVHADPWPATDRPCGGHSRRSCRRIEHSP